MLLQKKIIAIQIGELVKVNTYSKAKNNLNKVLSLNCQSIEELNKVNFENHPVLIVINNGNIITKSTNSLTDDQVINSTFPNLNIQDFYYEIFKTSNQTYISICRKDYVNKILQVLKQQKINVIGFSLGNLSISQLEAIYLANEIYTTNSLVKFKDGKITEIKKVEPDKTSYIINGLELTSDEILGFSNVLGYIINRKKTANNFKDTTAQLQNDFKQKRFFDIGLKAALGFIFTTLLISFLIFSSYNSKIEALQAELSLSQTQKASLLKLNKEVQQKESLVNELYSASSKTSWYLDYIGSSIPTTILLSTMKWQPLTSSKIKENEAITIKEQTILIQGISSNSNDFSEWTGKLEQAESIKSITVNDYGIGKKTTTSFKLEITIQ